jgi:hypothetical protein
MKMKNFIVAFIVLMSTQLGFADSKADSDFAKGDTLIPKIDGVELLNQEKQQYSPVIKLKKDDKMIFTGEADNELIKVKTEDAKGWIERNFVKKFTLEKRSTGENKVEEWKFIGEDSRMVLFVHLASVIKTEQSFNIWLRAEIKDPKLSGNFTAHSFKSNYDVDCKNIQRRTITQTLYSEHTLQGEEYRVEVSGRWQPWDPTVPSYRYIKTLCNQ